MFTFVTLSQSFVWEVVIGLNLNPLQNKIGYGLGGSEILITKEYKIHHHRDHDGASLKGPRCPLFVSSLSCLGVEYKIFKIMLHSLDASLLLLYDSLLLLVCNEDLKYAS